MKVVTLFGTRPEIIRLSRVIPTIDQHAKQVLVHTGQNYDPNLSNVFFAELKIRAPDVHMGIKATDFAAQIGEILTTTAAVLREEKPDRLLILGDTNSALAAIVAARMRIPVYHMEAGNRCYDDRVPEEINRRLIDHASDVLMPYTQRSKEHLLREGIAPHRILVTGNPILEVLEAYDSQVDQSSVLERFGVGPKGYFLVTLHRAENVDDPARLVQFFEGLARVAEEHGLPMIVSLHPRTADKLQKAGLTLPSPRLRLTPPLGFFDFVKLEKNARCVLSDSGTTQEECCLFGIPNVTLRDVTERPETLESSSNVLSGADPASILRAANLAMGSPSSWTPPEEYTRRNVSTTVAKIVLGHAHL